ncbi:unnamed protein product [Amoebophrya sp. A120]|nr:unnamed protein product [Amoebophrya sp. A120]|eukprot:GSA120T00021730001.1
MSGGFFIAPKNKGPSREEGLVAMRRSLGLEVAEEEPPDPVEEKKSRKGRKLRILAEMEAEEEAKKRKKPKPPATIIGTLTRPIRDKFKGVDVKHEVKNYVKKELLHRRNFRGGEFYLRVFLFLTAVLFLILYEMQQAAVAKYTLAFCKMSGFMEPCDSGECSLIISVRTMENPGLEIYQRGWFPETEPDGNDIVFVDKEIFSCCPLSNCCGFAFEPPGQEGSPMIQQVFCDSDEFGGGCGPDPWQCYFEEYLTPYEVTGLQVGRPWDGSEFEVISILFWVFLILTYWRKIYALYNASKEYGKKAVLSLPWFLRGILWWTRYAFVHVFMIPATKAIDVVSTVFGIPFLVERHNERMIWIRWMSQFAQLPEPPTESESEEEHHTVQEVVEHVMEIVKKAKYPSMKKQLKPLIKPLPFQWSNRTAVPEELIKRLRIADALERDRAMYKPDYLKEERHKYDAAFSNPLRLGIGKVKKVEAIQAFGPALRPKGFVTPPATPPPEEKSKKEENEERPSRLVRGRIASREQPDVGGDTKAAAAKKKPQRVTSSEDDEDGEEEGEELDSDDPRAGPQKYVRKAKVQEPSMGTVEIPVDVGEDESLYSPDDARSRSASPSIAPASPRPPEAGTAAAIAKAAADKKAAMKGDGFSRPEQKVAPPKKDELEMTPEEYKKHVEEREKRNKFKRMRGEPTSSDEERAALTRELGNLQAAERDAGTFADRGNVLGVVSMMRRTANKLAERKRKRDNARLVREQTGVSRTQAEIMRLPFDRRDGPDFRIRTRTDMQILETTPTLEKLKAEAFPTEEDEHCYQWRAVAFQNRLARDSTIFRYNPEWHREGKFQPPLQQVRGNLVVHKQELPHAEHMQKLRETLWYFRDQREYHAKHVTGDQEHWMKLLDGYKLWCRKAKFMKGFDRKHAPDLDFLFADQEGQGKALDTQSLSAVATKMFETESDIPDHVRSKVQKDLGTFALGAICADELGLLPHRVRHVPTSSRLLINQGRKRKDVGLWQNTAVEEREPGFVRWFAEPGKRRRQVSPEQQQRRAAKKTAMVEKEEESKNAPMLTFNWKKLIGLEG